ncbi:hypothetical protein SNEBB_006006 [Seison nebaliae]|nr:hypothetical protein SNEBB_006006 [Seison nebaliae]
MNFLEKYDFVLFKNCSTFVLQDEASLGERIMFNSKTEECVDVTLFEFIKLNSNRIRLFFITCLIIVASLVMVTSDRKVKEKWNKLHDPMVESELEMESDCEYDKTQYRRIDDDMYEIDYGNIYLSNVEVKLWEFEEQRTLTLSSSINILQNQKLVWSKEPNYPICQFNSEEEKNKFIFQSSPITDVSCKSFNKLIIPLFSLKHLGVWTARLMEFNRTIIMHEFMFFAISDVIFQISLDKEFEVKGTSYIDENEKENDYYYEKWRSLVSDSKRYQKDLSMNNKSDRKTSHQMFIHESFNEKLYFFCSIVLHCGQDVHDCWNRMRYRYKIEVKGNPGYSYLLLKDVVEEMEINIFTRYLAYNYNITHPLLLYKIGLLYDNQYISGTAQHNHAATTSISCNIDLKGTLWDSEKKEQDQSIFQFQQQFIVKEQIEEMNNLAVKPIIISNLSNEEDKNIYKFNVPSLFRDDRCFLDPFYNREFLLNKPSIQERSGKIEKIPVYILDQEETDVLSEKHERELKLSASKIKEAEPKKEKTGDLERILLITIPTGLVMLFGIVVIAALATVSGDKTAEDLDMQYVDHSYVVHSGPEAMSGISAASGDQSNMHETESKLKKSKSNF